MSDGKFKENLDKVDKLLRQFPHGVRAIELAEKLGLSRSAVYDYLNGLETRGKCSNEHGLWYSQASTRASSEKEEQSKEAAFLAEKSRIREDYVNGEISRAFRRTMLFINEGRVSKAWLQENRSLLESLYAENQEMERNSIEKFNPKRRERIRRLETAIVSEALRHWA